LRRLLPGIWLTASLLAQDPVKTLTLAEAEQIAVGNSPRLSSAGLTSAASNKVIAEVRAAKYPTLNGAVTGTGAQTATAIAAGALTTSSISSRGASGVSVSQLITDFGRTSDLTESARFRAAAQGKNVDEVRSLVRLEVDAAYFQTIRAESVLKVAQAASSQRRTTLRQIRALADSLLKSTLDVSFAEVALSESELAVYQAENDVHAGRARLSAAMGFDREQTFALVAAEMPPPLDTTPDSAIAAALHDRPDLEALGLNREAAHRFATAEAKLRYPTITALGAAGVVPVRDRTLHDSYAAAGVNVSIPILNGGLFMGILLIVSVIAGAVIILRGLALRLHFVVMVDPIAHHAALQQRRGYCQKKNANPSFHSSTCWFALRLVNISCALYSPRTKKRRVR